MTTPNEELIKQLRALGIPDWKTARGLMTEAANALQSQAERNTGFKFRHGCKVCGKQTCEGH